MSVFDPDQIEEFFPVGAFFGQRRIAKTAFNPFRDAVLIQPGFTHVVQIFVARDRAAAERFLSDCAKEIVFLCGLELCFDEVTHLLTTNGQGAARLKDAKPDEP